MTKYPLLVRDVLKRKHFESAKLIAGHQGVNRQVLWTHILEIKDFDSLINGGELILTTGVGLQLERATQIAYLQNLIRNDAAACVLKLVTILTMCQRNLLPWQMNIIFLSLFLTRLYALLILRRIYIRTSLINISKH